MNESKTEATLQSVKALQHEISAWEGRLASVRSEVDSLKKQKESLAIEIESIKERSNKEVEEKVSTARKANALLVEERKKLDADKAEFINAMQQFKQEKNSLEREKQITLDVKADAQKTLDRVGEFIRLVRDGSAKL